MSRPASPSRTRRAPAAVLGLSLLAAALAGCGAGGSDPRGVLGIVVSPVASVPDVTSSSALADAVADAGRAQSSDALVVADGQPHVAARGSLRLTTHNAIAQQDERAQLQQQLLDVVGAAHPDVAELDLLGAVALAAREIGAQPGPRTLVVVSSGLSTVAPLAFQQPGLLDADPQDVVASLQDLGALPDLHGTTLVMSGFGDTSGAQPAPGLQRAAVISIWRAVFEAAGARVHVDERPLTGQAAAGLPPVTPVPLAAPLTLSCTTVLPNSVVTFVADSDELVDPVAARTALGGLAGQLAGTSSPVRVSGTTARAGSMDGQVTLARARAQRVADLLVDLGVDRSRLTVEGLGSEFPEYVPDHDAQGALLPGPAAQNRSVRVVSESASCAAS